MAVTPLCITLPEAADQLEISRTQLRGLLDRRSLVTVRIGRYRLVRIRDLEAFREEVDEDRQQ